MPQQDMILADGWDGYGSPAMPLSYVIARLWDSSIQQPTGVPSVPARSVLDFPGATSQAKLVAALASGEQDLFVPTGTITVTAPIVIPAGIRLRGQKGAAIAASATNINALEIGGDDVVIEDLEIVACGTAGSFASFNGCGIYAVGRLGVVVRRVRISNHRSWGVLLRNCTDGLVEFCRFRSANVPASPNQDSTLGDIGLVENATRNTIRFNDIASGAGNGIYIQTRQGTVGTMIGNRVHGNQVRDNIGYGIFMYDRNVDFTVADTWEDNSVTHNRVSNITGSLINDAAGNIYGAGIYVQGANNTLVAYNQVSDVCLQTKDGEQDNPTLAPAGIGIINCRAWTCANNRVYRSRVFGYCYRNPNDYGTVGEAGVSIGNASVYSKWDGMRVTSVEQLSCTGDTMSLSGRNNFYFSGTASGKGYHRLRDCVGLSACTHLPISGGSGTFTVGETITGGTSAATGTVIAIYSDRLVVKRVSGTFNATTETITGGGSGATRTTGVPVYGAGFSAGTSTSFITSLSIQNCEFNENDGGGLAIATSAVGDLATDGNQTRNNKGIGYTVAATIAVRSFENNYSAGNSSQWSLTASIGMLDLSNANATLVATTPKTCRLAVALTADRTITLPTNEPKGTIRRVARTTAATGAFNLVFGPVTLGLPSAATRWGRVQYDGSAWIDIGSVNSG